jgi:hypothetical protein
MSARYDTEFEGFNELSASIRFIPAIRCQPDMTPNLKDLPNCRRPFGSSFPFAVIFFQLTRYDNECEGFNELSVPIRFILPIRCHIFPT